MRNDEKRGEREWRRKETGSEEKEEGRGNERDDMNKRKEIRTGNTDRSTSRIKEVYVKIS